VFIYVDSTSGEHSSLSSSMTSIYIPYSPVPIHVEEKNDRFRLLKGIVIYKSIFAWFLHEKYVQAKD